MARLEAKKLRVLVNDYYHGLITLESYREQRAELLDNIGQYVERAADTATTAINRTAPAEAEVAESGPPGKSRTPLLLGIAVVVAAAIAAFVMLSAPEGEPESASPEISGSARVSDPGTAIVEEFLNRNDWSKDNIANFLIAWNALQDEQRSQATQQRAYRRLTTSLHQRIREEAALSATPTSRFRSMSKFAEDIGAPYRLSGTVVSDDDGSVRSATAGVERYEPEHEVPSEELAETSPAPTVDAAESEPAAEPVSAEGMPPEGAAAADGTGTRQGPGPGSTVQDGSSDADPCPPTLANTRRPYCRDALEIGGEGPTLVVLGTGSFDMGSDDNSEESPVHRVTIGAPIAMSRDEISVAEFSRYCTAAREQCTENPWVADDYPVVGVSWDDAVRYADWISDQTGRAYRLPTEAEWEYAARAGTTTPYFFGDEVTPSAARSSANAPNDAPLPRSQRTVNRNPYRLYHMSGNVREWTLDAWYPDYQAAGSDGSARASDAESGRVVRGGSYSDPGDRLRSAARERLDRSHRDTMTGFRVVREVTATRD
jgi:formylglycine-generating enzyme required for sulfatase activity